MCQKRLSFRKRWTPSVFVGQRRGTEHTLCSQRVYRQSVLDTQGAPGGLANVLLPFKHRVLESPITPNDDEDNQEH